MIWIHYRKNFCYCKKRYKIVKNIQKANKAVDNDKEFDLDEEVQPKSDDDNYDNY